MTSMETTYPDPFDGLELPDRRPKIVIVPGGRPAIDDPLYAQAVKNAETPDPNVRIRLHPTIYDESKLYQTWPGVSWVIEFRVLDQARRFRRDLDQFVQGWVARERAQMEEESEVQSG